MKRFLLILIAVAMALLCLACGGADAPEPAEPTANETTINETTIKEDTDMASQSPVATITMADGGVIKVELNPAKAPNTVKNFISLANSGFYDGTIFHRVIEGFMIQGGDPTGTGTGGPGYRIKGEFSNNKVDNDIKHTRGVISMARQGNPYMPASAYNTAGSQFFIMHADSNFLDGDYAAFGYVTEGMDIVDQIATTDTDGSDKPLSDQTIQSIRVDTFGVDYGEPEKIAS